MRVAVFGGSGFIGSRICGMLANAGCDVVSVSRSGGPSDWASTQPWAGRVRWLQADLASNDGDALPLGHLDAAVSTIGNVRPAPDWEEFWGLHWDDAVTRAENGAVNERAAEAAARAGARRYVYISCSFNTAKAFEGPLEGYLDGKRAGEAAALHHFGDRDGALVVGPSLVYGGGRFKRAGALLASVLSSPPVRFYNASLSAIRGLSRSPNSEDWLSEVAFTPPLDVDVVARACAAGAVSATVGAELGPRRQDFYGFDGLPVRHAEVPFLDHPEIPALAARWSAAALAAAVAADASAGVAAAAVPSAAMEVAAPPAQSASRAKGPPFEGALVGAKPLLFPLPVAAFFAGLFGLIATGSLVHPVDLQ